jgi:putative iron-only hydrogenase system regulator
MDRFTHVLTIVVNDREKAHLQVNHILHQFADAISLRVGYPLPAKSVAIIFLIMELNLDEIGSLTGKLGQIPSVKVKVTTLKI